MVNVEHVSKKYGKKTVLEDINLYAKCGEQVSIIGKNGCGKTTLMQIMAGVEKPDGGSITYFNQNPLKKQKEFRKLCGYVPQENPLIEEISVKDNLRLWSHGKLQVDTRIIEMFQLKELMGVRVEKLSIGMKRRVGIACALLEWPPVLLMDEPTTAIDLFYKNSIHQWMKRYLAMNGILIMTTHDEQEILNSSRCIFMREGKMFELTKEEKHLTKIYEYMSEPN